MTAVDLRPEQKAAALVVAVGPQAAAHLLQYLSEDEVERLATEVAHLGRLGPETMAAVLREVAEEADALRMFASGGLDYARELISEWKGSRAGDMLERLMSNLETLPFGFVREIDHEQLVHVLKDEHPQTVALILAYQPAAYAAAALRSFEPVVRAEIALRVARMGKVSPQIIERVEDALRNRLGSVSSAEVTTRGGVVDLAAVLNHTDRTTERAILERLAHMDAEVADEVRALMFVFEDIAQLDDRSIQRVIQDLDAKELAYAMKGVAAPVRDAIVRNMSQRAADTLLEEIELLGAVRRADVEGAQTRVVAVVRHLEDAGEILITRAGEAESSE